MARLILALTLFAALALAASAALTLARTLRARPTALIQPAPTRPAPTLTEVTMPNPVRRVSYVLLMLLLLGVTSGWLGPA